MTTPEIIACTQPKKYIVRTLVVRIFKKKEKKNRVIVEIWEYLHYYKYYISTRLKEFKNRNTWMMNKLAMIERILSWNFSSLLFANEIQCFIQDVYIYMQCRKFDRNLIASFPLRMQNCGRSFQLLLSVYIYKWKSLLR